MFFDSEYRQRRDINQALDLEQVISSDIGSLQSQLRAMHENLNMLSVTVAALMEVARVDPAAVRARAEAMWAQLHPPPPVVPQTPDAIAHPRKPPPNVAPITCIKCGRSVPSNTTLMTGDGPICDPQCP
jgi:hypothetical protein